MDQLRTGLSFNSTPPQQKRNSFYLGFSLHFPAVADSTQKPVKGGGQCPEEDSRQERCRWHFYAFAPSACQAQATRRQRSRTAWRRREPPAIQRPTRRFSPLLGR